MAKVFRAAEMLSENVQSYVISCQYQESEVDAAVADGSFVELGELKPDTTYVESGDKDYNVYLAKAPKANSTNIAVIDYPGVSEGSIAGNSYRIGDKLFDLVAPAGRPCRARRLALHDRFWLGEDNFDGTVDTSKEYGLKDDSVLLATDSTGTLKIKLHLGKDFNYGQSAKGKLYLCEVIGL